MTPFTQEGYRATLVARMRLDLRHTEFGSHLESVPNAVLAFMDVAREAVIGKLYAKLESSHHSLLTSRKDWQDW